jgi:hypothetical protein
MAREEACRNRGLFGAWTQVLARLATLRGEGRAWVLFLFPIAPEADFLPDTFLAAASRSLSVATSSTAARMASSFGDRTAGAMSTRFFTGLSLAPAGEPVKVLASRFAITARTAARNSSGVREPGKRGSRITLVFVGFGTQAGYRFLPKMSKDLPFLGCQPVIVSLPIRHGTRRAMAKRAWPHPTLERA